jgi:hypothetical protein
MGPSAAPQATSQLSKNQKIVKKNNFHHKNHEASPIIYSIQYSTGKLDEK